MGAQVSRSRSVSDVRVHVTKSSHRPSQTCRMRSREQTRRRVALQRFPVTLRVSAQCPAICLPASPLTDAVEVTGNTFWWTDVSFVPRRDDQLVISVGLYQNRPGLSPLRPHRQLNGLIYTVTFTDHAPPDIRQLSGTSTTSFPNITCHPGGRFVLYCGTNNVTLHNTATNVRELTLMPDIGESFQTVAVSPSGTQIAIVARFYTDCVRLVTSALANTLVALRRTVNCTKICPLMRPLRDRSDHYLCTFSPDASRLLLASSHGCVVVFSWPRLTVHCLLTSAGGSERMLLSTSLATERSIDFDPRMHASLRLVTLGTSDRQIYTCDVMAEGCVKYQTDLPEGGSGRTVQCVRYSTMGDQVAVALAGALIYILQPDCSTWLYCVDRTVETLGIVSPAAYGEMQPATVQMAFSHADDLLAVSSTDGRVCLWQLPVDLSLKHLCRLALRQYLTYDSMAKLAIPRSVIDYLISPHTIEHKSGPSQSTQLVTWRGLLAPWM